MVAEAGAVRSVSIGRVYGRASRAIATNPLVIFGVALLFALLPQLATTALGWPNVAGAGLVTTGLEHLLFGLLAQGALVRATVAASEGRRASFGESLGAALPVALPLIGLSILVGLGTTLGFGLLIVPGVILYIFWVVAAPVLVEERCGVVGAMSRSRELTKGARWSVFALLLTMAILYLLVSAVGGVAVIAGGFTGLADPAGFSWRALVTGTALGTITTAVWSVIISSLYVELREWKDGPSRDALVEVFA